MKRKLAALVGLSIALTACTVTVNNDPNRSSTDTPTLSKTMLESTLTQGIEQRTSTEMRSVVCDGPLSGVIGSTQRCVATAKDGRSLEVTVTTTSTKGDRVYYDFVLGNPPSSAPAA